jgi:hypothetical protein
VQVAFGWVEGAALLLGRGGACPNARDASGRTPLMLAVDAARGGGPASDRTAASAASEATAVAAAVGSSGSRSSSGSSVSEPRWCRLWPAAPHSLVALLLQQPFLDVSAADLSGQTALHRVFAPNGCPGYNPCGQGNEQERSEVERSELLGMVLASPYGAAALETALSQRCLGTAAPALDDARATTMRTAVGLVLRPPAGADSCGGDGAARWRRVKRRLEKFEKVCAR